MGVVWEARQISLDRRVALKMILAGHLASRTEVQRFHREAEIAARFEHPNLVPIYEVGQVEGQHYYSMRLVEGPSLAAWMAEHQSYVSPRRAAEWLVKVARAVHYAHQRGIIHRDLKPANILLDAAGEPFVTDFGLARRMESSGSLTHSQGFLGTPNYVSPEQAQGKAEELTTATDIYSLGAVLYQLLVGRPPFQAPTFWETLKAVVEQEPAPPRLVRRTCSCPTRTSDAGAAPTRSSSIDRDLETICLKCLSKDPQARYASADALADDLERWLRCEPISARPGTGWERLVKWVSRRPRVAGLLALTCVSLVAGATGMAWQWREAIRARIIATDRLWDSYLAQARAHRWSGRPGRRFESLVAISNAAAIRPSLELRNEAIACLGLMDLQVQRQWSLDPPVLGAVAMSLDARLERYARMGTDGVIAVHGVGDGAEQFQLPSWGRCREAYLGWSRDGRFLAQTHRGSSTNLFCLWDLAVRKPLVVLPESRSQLPWAFAPDHSRIFVAEGGTLRSFGVTNGIELGRVSLPKQPEKLVADPTGHRLALIGPGSGKVLVWDLASGAIMHTLANPSDVHWCGWSPDGVLLACPSSDKRVHVWNVLNGEKQLELSGARSWTLIAAFNRAGDLLASCGWDDTTRFWNAQTGELLMSVHGQFSPLNPFSEDGRLAFYINQQQAGIWSIAAGRECRRLAAESVESTAFDPSGRILVGAVTDGARFWDTATGDGLGHLPFANCRSVFFSPDGRSLFVAGAIGLQQRPFTLDPDRGEVRVGSAHVLHRGDIRDAVLTADGLRVLATLQGKSAVLVIDVAHPDRLTQLEGPVGASSLAAGVGGYFACGSWQGSGVRMWNEASSKPAHEWRSPGSSTVAFSPDGQHLVTATPEEYRCWKTGTWEVEKRWSRENMGGAPSIVIFSPDGVTMVVWDQGGKVRLLDHENGRELASLGACIPCAFSPDGGLLAAYDPEAKKLLVWDLRLVRQQLAALRLDWDAPLLPGAVAGERPRALRLTIAP